MSRGQRMVLGAVAAVVVVVSLAVGVAAVVRDRGEARLAVGGVTADRERAPTASTATTFALVPVTGGEALPTTTAPPPPKPPPPADAAPAAPATTSPPPPEPRAGRAEHVLRAPPEGTPTRPVDKAKGCYSAVDPGWKVVECGALKREDLVFVWVVESKGKALRALVLRERTAGQWALALAAESADGWARVGVRGEDVSGDGRADLVFGFHERAGTKATIAEVVDGPGVVALSVALAGPATSVRLEKGALHTWQTRGDGAADHDTLRVIAGAWRVAASEAVPREAVPPSMV